MGIRSFVVLAVAAAAQVAHADVILNAAMTVDNQFTAYISTDPMVQGTAFLTGNSWPTTYSGSHTFTSGGTYYLQIFAEDTGQPAMFIGNFTLNTAEGAFINLSQLIRTGDAGWSCSTVGFGQAAQVPVVLGPNGAGPWGNFPAMGAAQFVWAPNAPMTAYFWTTITIVPTPAAATLLAIGAAVAHRRRR